MVDVSASGVSFKWNVNDTVGIFPNKGDQVSFAMDGGTETNTATFSGGGWALKSSATYAAYYPYNFYNRDLTKIPVSYAGQTQIGNNNTDHIGKYDFMAASVATPSNGAVAFDMQHLGCLVQLNINVPNAGELSSVTLTADEAVFVEKGFVDLTTNAPAITAETTTNTMTIKLKDVSANESEESITVYFMLAPANMTNNTITATITDLAGNEETIDVATSNFQAGKAYRKTITATTVPTAIPHYKVTTAGTLSTLIGEEVAATLTEVKISGPLNGTDIKFIREKMAKSNWDPNEVSGVLAVLDLSDATIVEGGEAYYDTYTTENNVLGQYMFQYSKTLETVILPKNITTVGQCAFRDSKKLSSVTMFEGLEAINEGAFYNCNLTEIDIPKGVKEIGREAFASNDNLVSIKIPASVETIEAYAFSKGALLSNIDAKVYIENLDNFILALSKGPFIGNHNYYRLYLGNEEVTQLIIPNETTYIPVFANCKSITYLEIPEGVNDMKAVGSHFSVCINLKEAKLPKSWQLIAPVMFRGSALTTVTIGDNVKNIYLGAFSNCPLQQFYSYTPTPPSINVLIPGMNTTGMSDDMRYSFYGIDKENATLYVPKGCKAAYEASDWATYFGTIVEME